MALDNVVCRPILVFPLADRHQQNCNVGTTLQPADSPVVIFVASLDVIDTAASFN